MNQGVTDVMMRTHCKMATTTISLSANVGNYELDTGILQIYDAYVIVGGNPYPLEYTTVDYILALRRTGLTAVSPAQYWAVGGSNLLLLHPIPATADTMTIYYTPRPATLSISSSSPTEVPEEFHPAIEFYAFYRGASFSDDTSSQGGQAYLQQYEFWIRRIKRWVGFKGKHRLPPAEMRRRPTTIPYHDRSVYPQ